MYACQYLIKHKYLHSSYAKILANILGREGLVHLLLEFFIQDRSLSFQDVFAGLFFNFFFGFFDNLPEVTALGVAVL